MDMDILSSMRVPIQYSTVVWYTLSNTLYSRLSRRRDLDLPAGILRIGYDLRSYSRITKSVPVSGDLPVVDLPTTTNNNNNLSAGFGWVEISCGPLDLLAINGLWDCSNFFIAKKNLSISFSIFENII